MAKRRPSVQDSVFERKDRPRGTKRWVAQLYLGTDPATARPRYKSSYHLTKTAAAEALSKLQEGRRKGTVVAAPSMTVAAYLRSWLDGLEGLVEAKTYVDYRRYAEKVLIPDLGHHRLDKLTRADAQALFTRYQAAGKGATWLDHLRGTARKAYNDAIELLLVATNPFDRMKLPKKKKRRFPVWTPDQIKAYFAAVGDDSDRNLYILAVFSGARAGELLALHRDDIAFDRGMITIGRSVSRVDGQGLVPKEPKSDAGWRTLTIHPFGMTALRRQLELVDQMRAAAPKWEEHGLVFPQANGRWRYVEFPRKKLQRLCEQLEFPVLRFHDLRHQHAALLIALGVHAKVISERLGHSSIQITMDRYGHLMAGVDQDASERLGKMLE